jgi:hypothetical protein
MAITDTCTSLNGMASTDTCTSLLIIRTTLQPKNLDDLFWGDYIKLLLKPCCFASR